MLASPVTAGIMVYGNTVVDPMSQSIMVGNRREFLPSKEFLVLKTMISLHCRPLQVEDLQADYPDATKENVATHLSRLRKRLTTIQSNINIRAVRDRGYCLFVV